MSPGTETNYRGFRVLVEATGFVILGRNGKPVGRHESAVRMRTHVRQLLRAEREANRANA